MSSEFKTIVRQDVQRLSLVDIILVATGQGHGVCAFRTRSDARNPGPEIDSEHDTVPGGELNLRVDGILTARLAVIFKSTQTRPIDDGTAYRVSHHEPTDIPGMEPYVFLEVAQLRSSAADS